MEYKIKQHGDYYHLLTGFDYQSSYYIYIKKTSYLTAAEAKAAMIKVFRAHPTPEIIMSSEYWERYNQELRDKDSAKTVHVSEYWRRPPSQRLTTLLGGKQC